MSAEPTADPNLALQPLAGRFALQSLIGRGGIGAVYRARDLQTGSDVAVKVLRPEMATDPGVVQRFVREANVLAQIPHPNVVRMISMGQDTPSGTIFFAQELLEGRDLRGLLEERRALRLREAVDILVPVMGGLVAAHAHGVVHRDIKPENVFLARMPNGETLPKVIDFGMSKQSTPDSKSIRLTRTGIPVGTPFYMAPEQVRGERDVDHLADVWSMATVLYEALAGRCPYDATNVSMLFYKILSEAPTRIETLAPHIPKPFADVIHRALEPARERRFPTMHAFLVAVVQSPALAPTAGEPTLVERHVRSLPNLAAVPTPDELVRVRTQMFAGLPPLPAPAKPKASIPDTRVSEPNVAPYAPAPTRPEPIPATRLQGPVDPRALGVAASAPARSRASTIVIAIVTLIAAAALGVGAALFFGRRTTPSRPTTAPPPPAVTTQSQLPQTVPNAVVPRTPPSLPTQAPASASNTDVRPTSPPGLPGQPSAAASTNVVPSTPAHGVPAQPSEPAPSVAPRTVIVPDRTTPRVTAPVEPAPSALPRERVVPARGMRPRGRRGNVRIE